MNEMSDAENSCIATEETCICLCKDKLKATWKSEKVSDIEAEKLYFLQIKINSH